MTLLCGNTIVGLAKGKYVVERPDPSVKDISGRAIFDNHAVNLISTIITSLINSILHLVVLNIVGWIYRAIYY